MTLRFTRANGEEVVIFHRDHPTRPPLRIRIETQDDVTKHDPIKVEITSNPDYIVIRSELADRDDFDLSYFLEK